MVTDNPPQISAIRWRIPASGCGFRCRCPFLPKILADIRVSQGIPGAKRPHRREESLPASWFLNQLIGRDELVHNPPRQEEPLPTSWYTNQLVNTGVEKYQIDIIKCGGLPPLLRLLWSLFLPLILSAAACVRNVSITPQNESPIIKANFLNPLIELLAYDENEEIQCHTISTLRNLAASSEKNKAAIVEAGAIEQIKGLVLSVPLSVQSEMTVVLLYSDSVKILKDISWI
ncbi:Vacuolar protein 8 [Puccinia graminis f. sp. tritici]|uniref:Vacuolar protein 8 n=1 Tax=Puccinia graminis f. sp. tritici TaxID=56615 RepID=A0A5B0PW91_PUCGR|nr:Vacuolar protein 8 [Puccinia graminis f. sp. tritici]